MAQGTTYTVRNMAQGPRGFHDEKTGYAELDPGQTATDVRFTDVELASAQAIIGLEITAGGVPPTDTNAQAAVGAKAYDEITAKDIKAALDEKGVTYDAGADKKALYDLYAGSFGPAGDAPVTPPANDQLNLMADDDLRETVKALTGEEPPADADRETLIKLARGEN